MERNEVLERLQGIFQEVFEDEGLHIADSTSAPDIEGWDSLMHMQLLSEVENAFDIRFTLGEVQNFAHVGDMCDAVLRHLDKH